MRRRWPALAATIPLALGWAVLAAHPAAASVPGTGPAQSGGVQPGGPVSSLSTPGMPSGTVTPQISGLQPLSGPQPQAVPGGGRPSGQNSVVTSSNWAGYIAAGSNGTYTSASANWTEPTGHCTGAGGRGAGGSGAGGKYAAFWVGLDGYTSSTVEQIGTEVDCSGSTPKYYAWYEIYPDAALNFPVTTNPVSPGDQFSGSVTFSGTSTFTLVLQDITRHWTKTVTATMAGADRSSAEVIAEAPCCTYGGGILPLTNFGTASFSAATVNGQSMATDSPVEIVMPDTSVSAVTSTGSFSVSYTGSPGSPGFPWFGSGPARSVSD